MTEFEQFMERVTRQAEITDGFVTGFVAGIGVCCVLMMLFGEF